MQVEVSDRGADVPARVKGTIDEHLHRLANCSEPLSPSGMRLPDEKQLQGAAKSCGLDEDGRRSRW